MSDYIPHLAYRVPDVADLPTEPVPMDTYAVETGRLWAGAIPPEYQDGGGWMFGNWDTPGEARDFFGIDLEDVPAVP